MPSFVGRVRAWLLRKYWATKKATPMNGQWIGQYSGTNTGVLVADLDDVGTNYAGEVFAYDNNTVYPITVAVISLPKDHNRLSLQVPLVPAERGSGTLLLPADGEHRNIQGFRCQRTRTQSGKFVRGKCRSSGRRTSEPTEAAPCSRAKEQSTQR